MMPAILLLLKELCGMTLLHNPHGDAMNNSTRLSYPYWKP